MINLMGLNILGVIVTIILIFVLFISIILSILDSRKKRKIVNYPFVSIIIPTYNDSKFLESCIKSIYDSFSKNKFEIFVINDNSKDETINKLNSLKHKFDFKIINNKINKGKANSINDVFDKTKGEFIFVIDSDCIANKKAIDDMIARFQYNPKVGGVSSRYRVQNYKSFLSRMQDIEYVMFSFLISAHNLSSALSLWGGCMAFRRKAFEDINGLSPNFLTEDVDAALKLQDKDWKVEQSNYPTFTYVPDKWKDFYNQKIRWTSGGTQCLIKHYKIYLLHPIFVLFTLSYTIYAFSFIYGMISQYAFAKLISMNILSFWEIGYSLILGSISLILINSSKLITNLVLLLSYPLLSLPYLLYDFDYRKSFKKIILVFPYSIIYFPILTVISIIGIFLGLKKYKKLAQSNRSW